MKEYFNLDKFVYYFVFFSWPYSSDLVIHPSLQEKFIIFAISVFLFSIKNNKVFLSRFSAFCIPLIKIQSLIFIPFIYSVVKTHKNKKFYISYFLVSTFMVLFIFFNQPETYFNSRLDFSSVFKQTFLSPVNAVNLFLIVVTIFLSIKTNLKNKNILFGFLFSNILLVVFMSVYRDIGNYLNSLNIFFIVIYVLIIYDYILKRFASNIFHNIVKLNLIFIFIFVIISFTIPRFERMNSIDYVMNYSTGSEEEIYYSCLEGVQYLNTFQKNNLFLYLDDFQTIGNENFLFLSDTFQCNSVENIIIQKCEKIGITNFKYENSMKIIEYKC